jgi:hypothetical protein
LYTTFSKNAIRVNRNFEWNFNATKVDGPTIGIRSAVMAGEQKLLIDSSASGRILATMAGQIAPRRTREMASLLSFLCRAWGCACRGSKKGKPSVETPEAISSDDLSAIRGIGIVIQDRLNRSGIKTYAQLAEATPDDLEAILGSRIAGTRIIDWIAEARKRVQGGASRAA